MKDELVDGGSAKPHNKRLILLILAMFGVGDRMFICYMHFFLNP